MGINRDFLTSILHSIWNIPVASLIFSLDNIFNSKTMCRCFLHYHSKFQVQHNTLLLKEGDVEEKCNLKSKQTLISSYIVVQLYKVFVLQTLL